MSTESFFANKVESNFHTNLKVGGKFGGGTNLSQNLVQPKQLYF